MRTRFQRSSNRNTNLNLKPLDLKQFLSPNRTRTSGQSENSNFLDSLPSMTSLNSLGLGDLNTPEKRTLKNSSSLSKLQQSNRCSFLRKNNGDIKTTSAKKQIESVEVKKVLELSSPANSTLTNPNDITRFSANFPKRFRSPLFRNNEFSSLGDNDLSTSKCVQGSKTEVKTMPSKNPRKIISNNENSDVSFDKTMNLLEESDWINLGLGERSEAVQNQIFRALPIENTLELSSKALLDKYIEIRDKHDDKSVNEFLRQILFDNLVNMKENLGKRLPKEIIYTHMGRLVGICDVLTDIKLRLKILALVSKIFRGFGDFQFALRYLRQYKAISHTYNFFKEEIRALKWLAVLCQELKQYDRALNYLKKMIRRCWRHNIEEEELIAYDLIGKQYFYKGDMKRAYVFREKMMNGDFLGKENNIRKMAVDSLIRKEELQAQVIYNKSKYRNNHRMGLVKTIVKEESEDDSLDLELLYTNPDDVLDLKIFNSKTEKQHIVDFSHHFYGHARKNQVLNVFFEWQKSINTRKNLGPEKSPEQAPPGPVRQPSGTKTVISHLTTNRSIKNFSSLSHQSIEGVLFNNPGCEIVPRKALSSIIRDIDLNLKKRNGELTSW